MYKIKISVVGVPWINLKIFQEQDKMTLGLVTFNGGGVFFGAHAKDRFLAWVPDGCRLPQNDPKRKDNEGLQSAGIGSIRG